MAGQQDTKKEGTHPDSQQTYSHTGYQVNFEFRKMVQKDDTTLVCISILSHAMTFILEINQIDFDNHFWVKDDWRPISNWKSADPEHFQIHLSLLIDGVGNDAADQFGISVLSRRFYEHMSNEERRKLRTSVKFIIVQNYNWAEIQSELFDRIRACESESWSASLAKLRVKFSWEFENYNKPSPEQLH